MSDQYLSIEEFNDLIQKWSGKTVKIAKQELDDYDETVMELADVSYETNKRRIDDYVPKHALQLNGTGLIENEMSETHPLPSSLYEIPLEDSSLYQFDGARFALITDRAIYTIEVNE
ncbi:hypothetical protein ACDX78_03415 [Virgibacillus oceani]